MRPDTLVYFIATEDLTMVKIGCSYLPPNRLSSLQGSSPVKLVMLVSVPGTIADERALQRRHMASHVHHEWFRCSPEVMWDIGEIRLLGSLPEHLRGSESEPSPIKTDHSYRLNADWRERNSAAQKKIWAERRSRITAQTSGAPQ